MWAQKAFKWKQKERKVSPHPVGTIIKNINTRLKGIFASGKKKHAHIKV